MDPQGEEEEEMSVFRWRYDETCEGRYCCGDCDKCDKEDEEMSVLIKGMEVLDHVPDGWRVLRGTTTEPKGYRFINNNKSRFGGEYKHALVPEEVADE